VAVGGLQECIGDPPPTARAMSRSRETGKFHEASAQPLATDVDILSAK